MRVLPGNIHAGCKNNISRKIAKCHTEPDKKNQKSKDQNGNCCTDQVMKFNNTDKSLSHSLTVAFNPAFFTVLVSVFNNIDILYTSYVNTSIRYFVRSYHPPISNIRIAIQSFQI